MLKKTFFILIGTLLCTTTFAQQTLVWADEFNGTELDSTIWTYDIGNGCSEGLCSWGNSELQYYTNNADNVRLENGLLILEAKNEVVGANQFTSARINTEGRVHFKYGTLKARIKIPDLANGLWPAFWLLGAENGSWPDIGEIDIAEWGNASAISAGVVNKRVSGTCHWSSFGSNAAYGTNIDFPTNLNDAFHEYTLEWTPTAIRCYIDGIQYYVIDISNPANGSLEELHSLKHILLNLAVGGSFTGIYNPSQITAPIPRKMEIDYIRLYQGTNDELFLANENLICDKFGVYTETTQVSDNIVLGADAELYYWNGLNLTSAPAFEGSNVLSFSTIPGAWYGFGFFNFEKRYLANFVDGHLKFHFKTNAIAFNTFQVGVVTGNGEQWHTLNSDNGLLYDNQWHEITVPLSVFNTMDFGSIKQIFMFKGAAPSSSFTFEIDNIYYQDIQDCNDCTYINGAIDNVWIGTNSGNWYNSESNWSLGIFPDYCHNVIIPPFNFVNLVNGEYGKAFTLDVKQGGSLFVQMGADLDVLGK